MIPIQQSITYRILELGTTIIIIIMKKEQCFFVFFVVVFNFIFYSDISRLIDVLKNEVPVIINYKNQSHQSHQSPGTP